MAESSLQEILERISKDQDIIEKISSVTKASSGSNPYDSLPEIMAAIAPALRDENSAQAEENSDEKSESTDTSPKKSSAEDLGFPVAKISEKITKNSKLLLALKPYLSRERSELIDTVIKLAQVTDLMKLIK